MTKKIYIKRTAGRYPGRTSVKILGANRGRTFVEIVQN